MHWFEIKSFLLGLLSASILWAIYYRNRQHIQEVSEVVKQKNKEAKVTDSKGIDKLIRSEIFRNSQHCHLASQLFPLNNIFVEPELMAYPFTNAEDLGDPPIIDQLIPYLPDWPELSGLFNLQGIPMRNLLNAPSKTIIIGPLGSGKSTILAKFEPIKANLVILHNPGNTPLLTSILHYSDYLCISPASHFH